jgi:hypothetical protein
VGAGKVVAKTLRMCTRCKVIQYTSEFSKHPSGRDGLQSVCKTCNRVYCRAYRQRTKRKVFDHYGAVCACCGESNEIFLTLDHVNNDGAAHRRSINAPRNPNSTDKVWRWLVITEFAEGDKFQILCYNCNCGKRDNGGVCPHQAEEAK